MLLFHMFFNYCTFFIFLFSDIIPEAKCDIDIRKESNPSVLIALLETQLNFTAALIKRLSGLLKVRHPSVVSGNCRWTKLGGKVLREITEGRAFAPDFNHYFSIQCPDIRDCQNICDQLSCNYIMRSKFDGLSHAYGVIDEIVVGKFFDNSIGYDSYRRDCFHANILANWVQGSAVTSGRGVQKEEICPWRKHDGRVLTEISEGRAFPPDFVYHRSIQCGSLINCQDICVRSSCNYIVRSKFDGITHMYTITDERLHSKHFDDSTGYDSFARDCSQRVSNTKEEEPIVLINRRRNETVQDKNKNCHWQELEGNVLEEINEGKALAPDFLYHRSMQCENFDDCQKVCNRSDCNYMVRSKFDGLTHMFSVAMEILQAKNVNESRGYDSFMRNCSEDYSTPVPNNPNCKWNKMNGLVLMEISEGRDLLPDFDYHSSAICRNFTQCQPMCEETSCNYIVRSKFNGLTHMYSVVQSKLHSEYVANSTGYDSYVKDCPSGYDVNTTVGSPYAENVFGSNNYQPYNPYNNIKIKEESVSSKNLDLIAKLNLERIDDDDAFFDSNKFINFSHNNFLEQFTGLRLDPNETETNESEFTFNAFGSTCKRLNWVDFGVVPDVRDQGSCGSCYAFTTVDLMASQYSIDRSLWNQSFLLSPQFIIDCVGPPNAFGCNGGRPVSVIKELASRSQIIPRESCYSYKNVAGKCSVPQCEVNPDDEEVSVKWGQLINLSGLKEKDKIADVLRWGPVIAFIDASLAWQFYNGSGIIKAHHCQQISNHAVLVVGYNYEGHTPYYIIKNSWGTDYGDVGYVRLQAGKNACNVAQNVVAACTSNCERLRSVKSLTKRPHSTGCIEVTSALAANSTIFL